MFENKLVAVVNKGIEMGLAMNAIAHATIGLGASVGPDKLLLDTYKDKDGNVYPNISNMPFIILKGKSGEIRNVVESARDEGIAHGAFVHTMTGGTYQEQKDNTAQTPAQELIYYCAVLCGPWDVVSQLTKKLSLYKG